MPDSVSGPEGPGPQNRKLAALCGIPLSTAQFLRLAISIVKALVELHQRNLAHKNITPATIFFDPLNYAATFSDLSPSANSVAPESTNETTNNLAETLAYLSPEQTGRTNQNIDHRSDLYSLGVIFYQLYTGVLPFQATDAPGWVHCHLARVPRSPAEIIPTLSPTVANLIMKLLAKTVDERYQTASALLTDLEKCYINWTTEGEITPFSLGKNDIPNHLLIPSRLYGRQEELTLLQSSFKRVISQASAEMVIITGYSGIGKSALVSELYKTIIRQHGQFIAVKFDQYKRNIPYLTIAEAFQELIHQILKSDRDQIDLWRTRFQQSMGYNAQLIIDMIPKFELIIGPQSPLENVLPHAAQNRFTRIFLEFIHVFTTEYPSLTIFFDDLQWADPASLKLIEDLISDSESHDLLLIGAYRNNEVDASHALMQTLNKLDQVGIKLQTLTLAPLTLIELGQMLADIFLMPQPKLSALTRLIYHKTAGNPFFTIQFLGSLHSEGLIFFDRSQEHWNWNLAGIEAQQLTDNVVTLMTMKLRKLSPETQEILSLAACIGNHFEFDTLRAISPFSACELRQPLAEALQEELIQHQSLSTLTFIHDRVQQACYLLIPTSQRPAVHLRIGRLMLKCCPLVQPEETLFDTVHQLNQGAALLTSPLEKKELAQLNLRAGIKAKTATAYIAARNYFVSGTRLLVESVWQTDYALAFELFKGLAEAEYLSSNYTASKQQLELLLNLANTDLEKAELYNILIVQDTLLGNYSEAIQSGCKALRLLDIIVPKTNLKAKLNSLLETNKSMLQERPFSSLLEAAEMSDPKRIASLELLSNMVVPARYTDSTLFALIAVLNVNISLRFGLTPKSTVGYTAYGMVLNSVMGQYQQALEFGELSLQLSERFNAPAQKCQACFMIGHYLNHWVRPLKLADHLLFQ
ncbi:MAG: AAA family ATPase, partial [Geopsychrobacter sp.]|nr:AAA family ATPase [Geopsychrobacter sp.]